MNIVAMVLAGGEGTRLYPLTAEHEYSGDSASGSDATRGEDRHRFLGGHDRRQVRPE